MCHHREAAAEWEALARKAYENREEERTESDVKQAEPDIEQAEPDIEQAEPDIEQAEPDTREKAEPPTPSADD